MHSRVRIQLTFSILLMSSLGTRRGEFIESDAWKTTNEGLLYDDVQLTYQNNPEYSGFFLKVRLRNQKGHRDNDKHAYVPFEVCQHVDSTLTTSSPVLMLCEEPTIRSMCPVTYFLAMGLADKIFSEGDTLEKLQAHPIPPGTASYCFKYVASTKNMPIMRTTCPNGAISDDRILSYNSFNNLLKGLG
jgi:hypothetical protein